MSGVSAHWSACPVCGGSASVRRFQARDPHYRNPGHWWVRECQSCGSFLLDPLPSEAELLTFYPEDEYYAYRLQAPRPLLKRVLQRLTGFPSSTMGPGFRTPGSLLDFGCGAGDYLLEMSRRGWKCCGVEVSKRAVRIGRELGFDVRRSIDGPDGFSDESFEYVRAYHALEHVLDPYRVLREMYRVLKPGGTLFVGVPTTDGLNSRFFGPYWWYLGAPVHPVSFSTRALVKLMQESGFRITSAKTNSDFAGTVGSMQIYLNRRSTRLSSEGILFRLKPMLLVGHWLAKLEDLVHLGDKLEVIALKPER